MPRVTVGWQPAVVSCAGAATLVVLALFAPSKQPMVEVGTAPVRSASLPGGAELSLLFDLHDAHGGSLSAADPTLHRSEAAEAHAALLERADEAVADNL